MGLGDAVHAALEAVGVTDDRVVRWLGQTCGGCAARRERLNQLGWWAARVLRGQTARAREHLEGILNDD